MRNALSFGAMARECCAGGLSYLWTLSRLKRIID